MAAVGIPTSRRKIRFPIYSWVGKRALDVAVSSSLLVATLPVSLGIAALIKLDSPGPVFFKQTRSGKDGKPFTLLKFRSMAARNNVYDKTSRDEVTRIGKFIRSKSLDEIPQLINVFRGEMSLIGPRPWLPEYFENMNDRQRERYRVRPGISGLAQARGRNALSIFDKIECDLDYVNHVTFRGDVGIVVMTLLTMFNEKTLEIGKEGILGEIAALKAQSDPEPSEENDAPRKRTVVFGVTVDHAIGYHEDLADELAESGWNVHFVSSGGPALEGLSDAVVKHEVPMERQPKPLKDLESLLGWLRVLIQVQPDVVMAGTPKASLLGMLAAKIMGVQDRIYFIHGLRLETATGRSRDVLLAIEKLTALLATRLIAVSPAVRRKVVEMHIAKPSKVNLLGIGSTQGVDLERFSPKIDPKQKANRKTELGLDPSLPVVGFVGRLTRDKGIVELEQAMLKLKEAGHECQLLLIGPSEDELGEAMGAKLKDAGVKVVETGRVHDTADYYTAMDIFCLPSYREGLPNVVLESFASQIPVVATDVTGNGDIIEDGKTGLLVEPRNATALAEALERLIVDQDFAASLAEHALTYVVANFDSKAVVASQAEFINQL